jgi:hypothetical protein
MAKANEQGVSFHPDDQTAGGYLNDVRATVVSSRIVEFDFDGKTEDGQPRCCWGVTFRPEGGDEGGDDDRTEYYTVGTLDKFTPSSDGRMAIPVSASSKISKKGKAGLFGASLVQAGVELRGDVSVIEGIDVHLNVLPMPKMTFKQKDGSKKEEQRDFTAVTKVYGDGEAAGAAAPAKKATGASKAAPKTKAAPAAKAAAATATDDEAADAARGVILGLLAEKGGTVSKSVLPNAAFQALVKQPDLRNRVIGIIAKDEWLGSEGQPWTYEGGELTLGE